jgi:hypothetical protein
MPKKSVNLGLRPGLYTACHYPALPGIGRPSIYGLSLPPKLRSLEGLL